VLTRASEGRKRIAGAMAEAHDAAQVVHRELQPLIVAAERHGEKCTEFPAQVVDKHRDVVQWEGRSGFLEPYRELAQAYREIADLVDKWWSVRNAQLACEHDADAKREKLVEVEELLGEQRELLRIHESNIAGEVQACEDALGALGEQADRLELELLDLASRFTAPLRAKPELGSCFRELTKS
jgi:serine/threonine-protein kinase